ncbi:MAG: hypothetical protein ACKN9T_08815 [Candidatus Methylumidiphilus sp.]
MMTESKPEAPKEPPDRQAALREAAPAKPEDYPFYIVPPPPIPGQTGWSIVPW